MLRIYLLGDFRVLDDDVPVTTLHSPRLRALLAYLLLHRDAAQSRHHLGYAVNHKRVQRLMQMLGVQAIYPRPKTTRASQERTVYPYLLRGLEISRPNFVWSADITYVPMHRGFTYLVAATEDDGMNSSLSARNLLETWHWGQLD